MTGQQKRLSVEIFRIFSPDFAAFFPNPLPESSPFWGKREMGSRGTISIGLLLDMFHVEQAYQLPLLAAQSPMLEQSKPGYVLPL